VICGVAAAGVYGYRAWQARQTAVTNPDGQGQEPEDAQVRSVARATGQNQDGPAEESSAHIGQALRRGAAHVQKSGDAKSTGT